MPREIIRSKYFSSQVMEESLNDFQQTKTKYLGPKNIKKTKPKAKPKKRVKGQKDIRTLIQKKNELVTFTKDFNNVCAKNGIDIDSQELQLAIALSKSLHEKSQSEAGISQSNKTLTSQERTNQIRRTLQEYGFKVPETKIKSEANKRVKKYRKQYKLLLITEEERREKISYKYSQILFQYPDPQDFYERDFVSDKLNKGLYYLCTNISYSLIKSNDIFHVPNILQEITVKKGSLLRDWSNIPGRPYSPVLIKDFPTSILDIDFTQAELNTILSGTLIAAQEVFNSKIQNCSLINIKNVTESQQCKFQIEEHNKGTFSDILLKNPEIEVNEFKDIFLDKKFENNSENTEITMLSSQKRSLSPDLFGDDASSVIDNTIMDNDCNNASINVSKTTDNIILDLTEPTIIDLVISHSLPETSNVTKRKSNDFMDLTECVATSSQKHKTNLISQSIHTCESKVIYNDHMEITECINTFQKHKALDGGKLSTFTNVEAHIDLVTENHSFINKNKITSFDLTQSSNSDDELPMVEINGTQKSTSSDTIIVDFDDYGQFSNNEDVIELNSENIDDKNKSVPFTQNISQHLFDNFRHDSEFQHASDKFQQVSDNFQHISDNLQHISGNLQHMSDNFEHATDNFQHASDSFLHMSDNFQDGSDIYQNASNNHHKDTSVPVEKENNSKDPSEISDIDLTQSSGSSMDNESPIDQINNLNCDDYNNLGKIESSDNFQHSLGNNDTNKSIPIEKENNSKDPEEISDIDLTQSPHYCMDSKSLIDQINNLPCDNNLGKIGDVSIDYDEICVDTANVCPDEQFDDILSKYMTNSSNVTVHSKNSLESSKNNQVGSCSNISEIFKLSDRELNYPLCKSDIENFYLCDISENNIINLDESNHDSSCKNKHSLNRSLSDSCLPSVSFKDKVNSNKQTVTYIKLNESIHSTPIKAIIKDDKISVATPANSEYLIKVREVTPMLDYAAMSSPERNKELEKYGLKPFKRKRAIQLLTHLYNQTHPIVECCSEEPIPAKKLKTNSPKKTTKSPKKKNSSPRKSLPIQSINTGTGSENVICYMETKDIPDIKDIDCSSDDWIFQKREKAKIHSCRVPLHIAFHNYVSCRRGLREAILRYEPVNIDNIHKDLVSYGYRYNPKDLLKFLDKKCITVKTADNNARNCRK